jgi:hypothetical protein
MAAARRDDLRNEIDVSVWNELKVERRISKSSIRRPAQPANSSDSRPAPLTGPQT